MEVEMPTVETIRKLVQSNQGVAFMPRMCVGPELEQGTLRAVKVNELHVERKIRLVYPARRALSHAAKAFLEAIRQQQPAAPPFCLPFFPDKLCPSYPPVTSQPC